MLLSRIGITAIALFGVLTFAPVSTHAAIVRSTNGNPVLSTNGNCVISNWEGSEDCAAAKAGTGDAISNEATAHVERQGVVYFDFNKSSLSPKAKHDLDVVAKKLRHMNKHDHNKTLVIIAGYADRIGSAAYDWKLAMKRAQTVRAYLVAKGIHIHKLEVRSFGKSEPHANCPADMKRTKLIECLREDRRVEVDLRGRE
jgi:outer membrane protein OmpA-like peptidoglycan-associated protein